MMIMILVYNVILFFYFVVLMKNNVNTFGNVHWNVMFSFEQLRRIKQNKDVNRIWHELVRDFDLGKDILSKNE